MKMTTLTGESGAARGARALLPRAEPNDRGDRAPVLADPGARIAAGIREGRGSDVHDPEDGKAARNDRSGRGTAPTPGTYSLTVVRRPKRRFVGVSGLQLALLAAAAGLVLMGLAVSRGRAGHDDGMTWYWLAQVIPFTVEAAVLIRARLSETARRVIVGLIGIVPAVYWRMLDPVTAVGFDEHLHVRTLADLLSGSGLFSPNPLLAVSPYYPGLETATAAIAMSTGLPGYQAGFVTILISRFILVFGIYALAQPLLRSSWAASIAVLVYACSPQFFAFNSQFAYQTMALPLGLAGILLLNRAQDAVGLRRGLLFAGSLMSLSAMIITHHLTGWVMITSLVMWSILTVRRVSRTWVLGTGLSVLVLLAWTSTVYTRLAAYLSAIFGAAIEQMIGALNGTQQREAFSDSGGAVSPLWERLLLISYAGLWALAGFTAGLILLRSAWRQRSMTQFVFAVLAVGSPMALVGRVSPSALEIGDRSSTFLFVPMALATAGVLGSMAHRSRVRTRSGNTIVAFTDHRFLGKNAPPQLRLGVAVVLIAALGTSYLGAAMLGWGPEWNRLPGPYMVSADYRSADAQVRAGVTWAEQHLAPGSRIVADRYPAVMLSSQARLYPVVAPAKERGTGNALEPANIYFAPTMGPWQINILKKMQIRYVWVDQRLATDLPRMNHYVYPGENYAEPDDKTHNPRLTARQLTKFDRVKGMRAVYRNGPIVIYDAAGLGVQNRQSGYVGQPRDVPVVVDLLAGALIGLGVRLAVRGRGRRILEAIRHAGLAGAAAVGLSIITILGAALLSTGLVPGPGLTLGLLAVTVPPLVGLWRERRTPATVVVPARRQATVAGLLAAAAIALVGLYLAWWSAWQIDVVQVQQLLERVGSGGP